MAEIPCSQRHAALGQLAAAYRRVLEEQSRRLARAVDRLDNDGTDAAAAKSLQDLKDCTRVMGAIEGYGMPPLHCQSDQAVFLNDILSAMHGEVGLPFPCPAASPRPLGARAAPGMPPLRIPTPSMRGNLDRPSPDGAAPASPPARASNSCSERTAGRTGQDC